MKNSISIYLSLMIGAAMAFAGIATNAYAYTCDGKLEVLVCRGKLHAEFQAGWMGTPPTPVTEMAEIQFTKSKSSSTTGANLQPGQCGWKTRAFLSNEPTIIRSHSSMNDVSVHMIGLIGRCAMDSGCVFTGCAQVADNAIKLDPYRLSFSGM
jgi:hypothetical protein